MKHIVLLSTKIACSFVIAILFSVAAYAQWAPKVKLSTNSISATLNENMASCLAVNNDTLHVVWSDKHSSHTVLYYRRSADTGLTWNTIMPITDSNGAATFPAIAVSGSAVHVAWMDSLLGHRASFYKRSLDGGNTWGPAVCLDSISAFWPGIAASGSLVVVSINKQQDSANTEVYFRRSLNNGAAWDTLQRISNAPNRSEDPAIAAKGSEVYLSWNDKRSGTMEIYYRHSTDAGVTWGPETAMTSSDSYTTMVSLNRNYVDVVYALNNSGNFDSYLRNSNDTGSTFGTAVNLTNTPSPASEAYPFMVRDSMNLHIVYLKFGTGGGPYYLYSGDGGSTWDTTYHFGTGGQPFIAYTTCVLHVIYGDSGAVYYRRNATGNAAGHICYNNTSSIENNLQTFRAELTIAPNPVLNNVNIRFAEDGTHYIELYDISGRLISNYASRNTEYSIGCNALSAGIYILKMRSENGVQVRKFVKQ